MKQNVAVSHIKSAKCQRNKEKLLEKEARERDLARAIKKRTTTRRKLSMKTPRSTK